MNRWIVTGCNGYLGQEVCRALVEDRPVIGVARRGREAGDLSARGVVGCDYDDLPDLVEPGDVFVHCAGKTGHTGRWEEFERVNVRWSVELFRLAAERRAACFVYLSSVAALGYKNRPGGEPLAEDVAPELSEGEYYGRSKWEAEQALAVVAANSDTRLIVLRPGLVYGRRPIGAPQTWFRRGWLADPRQRVPLVHIDNLLAALKRVVQMPDVTGTFFVVDPEQPTLAEFNRLKIRLGLMRYPPWPIGTWGLWLGLVAKGLGRRLLGRAEAWPPGHLQATLRFHRRRLVYSTAALRAATGWEPVVSLVEGCRDAAGTSRVRRRPAWTLARRRV